MKFSGIKCTQIQIVLKLGVMQLIKFQSNKTKLQNRKDEACETDDEFLFSFDFDVYFILCKTIQYECV